MLHRVVKRWVLLVAVAGSLLLSGCAGLPGSTAQATPGVAATGPVGSATATGTAAGGRLAPSSPTTDLPTVTVQQLPAQAGATLGLIAAGGPYPYSRDGVTFGNREQLLPEQPSGFYTEYTVVTPGSADRGARRIVAGRDGSRFYTDDHYASFAEVVDP
jgi:ribonuclease T1